MGSLARLHLQLKPHTLNTRDVRELLALPRIRHLNTSQCELDDDALMQLEVDSNITLKPSLSLRSLNLPSSVADGRFLTFLQPYTQHQQRLQQPSERGVAEDEVSWSGLQYLKVSFSKAKPTAIAQALSAMPSLTALTLGQIPADLSLLLEQSTSLFLFLVVVTSSAASPTGVLAL